MQPCRMRAHRNLNTVAATWSQSPRLGTVQAVQTSLSPGIVAVTSATCLVSAVRGPGTGFAEHWLIIGLN